jgi:hypothetical protein
MEKIVIKHSSFQEAEKSDLHFYRSLSGQKRLEILLELIQQDNKARGILDEFKRVYRIVKLHDIKISG